MSDVQSIKDKIDVADLIAEYVQLKPAGVNKKGLCPFHREKSPSFMVNSERQSWHCFGCGKGGDIFSFIQEIEGMEFVEALKYLAGKAGVPLDVYHSEVNTNQKNRIKEINSEAARFFHNFLLKLPVSKPALDYLKNRGLKDETIENWQIGFISEQWDLLTQYLLKKGFSVDDLVASGLTIMREGADARSGRGFYDRFRGRIMFPIWDVHGEVVGFTGRILVEKDNSGGKYVNTPQTIVYDKSRVIFGLNKGKQEIKNKDLVVMVEGQMDVIACHQAGMKNVVASSGTALTEEQVKLLARYSKNINMAFDADEAGQNAARRGIDIAISQGLSVKAIIIPEGAGKDPDECIKKNPEVWFKAVENAQGIMDWYFARAFKNKNLNDPKQKQMVANELLSQIALIPFAVEKDHWLRQLSEKLNVDVGVLREDLEKVKNNKLKNQKVIVDNSANNNSNVSVVEKTRLDFLVEDLFGFLLMDLDRASKDWDRLPHEALFTSSYSELYKKIENLYNMASLTTPQIEVLRTDFSGGAENIVDLLLMKGELEFSGLSGKELVVAVDSLIQEINNEWKKKKRKELQIEIERAEKEGDSQKLKLLLENFNKL